MEKEWEKQGEPYLKPGQAAQFIRFTTQTLANWRSKGLPPPYLKIRKAIRYRLSDLIEFMEAHKISPR